MATKDPWATGAPKARFYKGQKQIMTPEEAEEKGEKFSGWRLKTPPVYKTTWTGKNAIRYDGQSVLQNIERRTLESRVEAVILLAGTTFTLEIPPELYDSAMTWDANLGRPTSYPQGKRGQITKPEDPYLSMDPGVELYFFKPQKEAGKKEIPPKYVEFNALLQGGYNVKSGEWEEDVEEVNPQGEIQRTKILREPILESVLVQNLQNVHFRKKNNISGYAQKKNSFFSRTSKMGSASFSVMAGSPSIGGTCPATDLWKSPDKLAHQMREIQESGGNVDHRRADPKTWICNYCYAGKSNYIYRNVQWTEVGRWVWLSGMFKHGYDEAIETMKFILKCHLSNIKMREKAGEDPSFFRIHDSGDFNMIPVHKDDRERFHNSSLSTYDIWHDIISDPDFAKINFWAPTRMWAQKDFRERVSKKPPPKNFSLRPSALHVDDISPDINPFSGGSTVHTKKTTFTRKLPNKMNEVVLGKDGKKGEVLADWECPAYTNKNACIGAGGPNGEPNCRVCWLYPDWSVSYKAH